MFIILACFSFACRDNPPGPQQGTPPPPVTKAVYVLNEGAFSYANGARLCIYDIMRDSVYRDVYESANNGSHLGGGGDDIKLYRGRAYILMSNSENLAVISLETHRLLQSTTLPGSTPHDVVIDSVRNRAYISRLYLGSIFVVDINTLTVIDSISVGLNPQGMVIVNGELFVCNSGFGVSRTVSVVDLNTDTVKASINVGEGPTNAAVAPDGKIWIASTGISFPPPTTPGSVFVIDQSTRSVVDSIPFSENLNGTISMGRDGYAYVVGGAGVHRIHLSSRSVTLNFIPGSFYALAVEQVSGDIYVTDARTFTVDGDLYIFSDGGVQKKKRLVQKIPGAIAFK